MQHKNNFSLINHSSGQAMKRRNQKSGKVEKILSELTYFAISFPLNGRKSSNQP